ncbi:protein ANTAGONIST OF LIKE HETEROCHROMATIN PROTEIN 1-like, partial [Aphis craccivora]
LPQNSEQWLKICQEFNEEWNFPHCLGAIDGKHIVIQSPNKSGTEYFNYKDNLICGKNSKMDSLCFQQMNRSMPRPNIMFPYVFVVDSAFALNKHMMKPYSGVHDKGNGKRVFNYRLSRARRVVENAFGIMASVFRVFRRPILLNSDK